MANSWLDGEFEPLAGDVQVSAGSAWDESALEHRDIFEMSLRDAGLLDKEIAETLGVRDEVAERVEEIDEKLEPFRYVRFFRTPPEVAELYHRRSEAIQRLINLFKARAFQVELIAEPEVRIPVFVLSAPDKPGCRAEFTVQESSSAQVDCSITVFGTGLGGSGSVSASSLGSFTCDSGEAKVVFVPVTIPVEKITLLEQGRPLRSGWRVDASKLSRAGAMGVRLLPTGNVIARGAVAERYPLSEDPTGAIAEYTYKYEASTKMSPQLGVKAPGVELSLNAAVELGKSVTLTFGLRSGTDYELHFPAEGQGALWAKPTCRSVGSQGSR